MKKILESDEDEGLIAFLGELITLNRQIGDKLAVLRTQISALQEAVRSAKRRNAEDIIEAIASVHKSEVADRRQNEERLY